MYFNKSFKYLEDFNVELVYPDRTRIHTYRIIRYIYDDLTELTDPGICNKNLQVSKQFQDTKG